MVLRNRLRRPRLEGGAQQAGAFGQVAFMRHRQQQAVRAEPGDGLVDEGVETGRAIAAT